jgi:hypothetical protein
MIYKEKHAITIKTHNCYAKNEEQTNNFTNKTATFLPTVMTQHDRGDDATRPR